MGIEGWYLTESNSTDSNMTARRTDARQMAVRNERVRQRPAPPADSSYIEFRPVPNTAPARKVQAPKPAVNNVTVPKKAVKTKAKRKKKNVAGRVVLCLTSILIIGAAVASGSWFYLNGQKEKDNLKKEVVIEAGSVIRIEDFFSDCPNDAKFVTDVSDIDTSVPAVYQLTVFYEKAFTENVTLKIEDHTGPEGVAISQTVYTTWKMPEAEECVEDLYDLSGIAKVDYEDGIPAFGSSGCFKVPVVVTDMYGNDTVINVPFTVIDDREAPVIEGVHDFDIEGDATGVDLLDGVTAYDDHDLNPIVRVNDTSVNYKKSGVYDITYSAMDQAGNVSNVSVKFKITLPDLNKNNTTDSTASTGNGSNSSGSSGSSDSGSSDPAYAAAEKVMSSLWRDSDVETARAIFTWVHSHISYQTVTGSLTYEEAAYRGFSRKSGDCYVYFACAKMLLDCAGIPNLMVERFPVYTNGHYWNLVQLDGEWYHCDATVFRDHPAMYFMCTDSQINDSHHAFNGALYPERAGGSTDYLNKTTPTPTPEPTATPEPTQTPEPTPEPKPTDTPVNTPYVEPPVTTETDDPVVIEDPETPVTTPDYGYSDDSGNNPGSETDITYAAHNAEQI